MPDEGVAAKLFAVRGCVISNSICAAEGEIPAVRFSGVPFHGVLRRDRSNVSMVVNDLSLSRIIANG